MKMSPRRVLLAAAGALSLVFCTVPAFAVITSGPGGSGVTVGNSSLIPVLDYSDTFTQTQNGGAPNRPSTAAVQPPAAYVVENIYLNPPRSFAIGAGFSFASDTTGAGGLVDGVPAYPGSSGSGSATGITQTGGGVDYGIVYGGRDQYVVQVDAVQVGDRIDITSGPSAGTIFAGNSISVFFRGNGSGAASLFNGATDTPIPSFNSGITGSGRWHNYAVRFDRINKQIELYVDETSRGIIDLTTFAGGLYQNFSNGAVGAGAGLAGGESRTWTDNFQVGGVGASLFPQAHPNPGAIPNLPGGLVSYWDFDEASGPVTGRTLDFAYDRKDGNHGSFAGTTARTFGLMGRGAAEFHDTGGEGVNAGPGVGNNFSTPSGISVEALFVSGWSGLDQSEFFRKEDGGNRILLSFQSDANTNNAFGQLIGSDAAPGISLGLNTGGYAEMDVALDGQGGRPTLAMLNDGEIHHIVATYDAATGVRAMYMDGNLIGMFDGPDNVPIVDGGTASAFIGSSAGGEPFTGTIDEVAVWNRALSASEIAAHFQNVQSGQNYFVPEPGSWALAITGLVSLAGYGWRSRRRPAR